MLPDPLPWERVLPLKLLAGHADPSHAHRRQGGDTHRGFLRPRLRLRAARSACGRRMSGSGKEMNSREQTAVVTGAGSPEGIGFAIARRMHSDGFRVFITSTTDRIHDRAHEL